MGNGFDIGSRHVGDGSPCFIMGEVGLAHDGSLRIAHDFIDAIADAGADAVKFQCHIAEAESTPDEQWRVEPKWVLEARYEYWKRTGFDERGWQTLKQHCVDRGVEFMCSPFSVEAVKLLDPLVPAWKVPSGEITNEALLRAVARTKNVPYPKPIILSSGMSTEEEISNAFKVISSVWDTGMTGSYCPDWALLQCTSEYPAIPEHVGLGLMSKWKKRFLGLVVGLSDHSGYIYPSLAAVALGASIVEVHVKLSQYDQGLDASSSITPAELKQLCEGVRFIEKALQPVDKDAMAKELEPMRKLFMRKHERKAAAIA